MLKDERRQYILNTLTAYGKVETISLAQELSVTEDTIRKDLQSMEKEGLIDRVYGGALRKETIFSDFHLRKQQYNQEKENIASTVAQLLLNYKLIYIDSSTTNLEIAKQLIALDFRGEIFTNSPTIALELVKNPYITLNIIGGQLDNDRLSISGSEAIVSVNNIRFECSLIGSAAISAKFGLSNTNLSETVLKKEVIKQSNTVITAVVKSKLEVSASYKVADSEIIDILVTDETKPSILDVYRDKGIEVISVHSES